MHHSETQLRTDTNFILFHYFLTNKKIIFFVKEKFFFQTNFKIGNINMDPDPNWPTHFFKILAQIYRECPFVLMERRHKPINHQARPQFLHYTGFQVNMHHWVSNAQISFNVQCMYI